MEEIFSERPLGSVQMTGKEMSPEGALGNVKDIYLRPQEGGFDTMLNILESRRMREERERAEGNNGLHCIFSSILM